MLHTPCPEANANFLSRLFLVWIYPIVHKGWKAPLKDEDLWELRDFERGEHTTKRLLERRKVSQAKGEDSKNATTKSLIHNNRRRLIISGLLKCFTVALKLTQPILLNELIKYIQNAAAARAAGNTLPPTLGLIWAFALLGTAMIYTVAENQYFMLTFRVAMSARSAVQGLLYDKSLKMSPSARAGSSLGEIVNLMQLDSQRIGDFAQFCHIIWSAPVQLLVSIALLFNFIGWSAAIGLVATLVTLPLQGKLMSMQMKLRKQSVGITDTRVKLMNEILQGIKAVKFYAWEKPFSESVDDARAKEVDTFRKVIWVRSLLMAVMLSIPLLIAVVTFAFFRGVFKRTLVPATVFTAITLLNALRQPVMMIPMVVTQFIDARIGIKRIERFLGLEDADDYARKGESTAKAGDESTTDSSKRTSESGSEDGQDEAKGGEQVTGTVHRGEIQIQVASFKWSEPGASVADTPKQKKSKKKGAKDDVSVNEKPGVGSAIASTAREATSPDEDHIRGNVLEDISMHLTSGKVTAVVGRVGAGKSSLVHAILGEMQKVSGTVSLKGSVAYVAQTAWIFNDTLKNNILFGKDFDEKLYRRAIKVSALGPDLDVLPAGDQTAIGEKGINLSGGQKQRVSIARAVYADADVYLFDDPLSALDAHVGATVFEKCLSNKGALRTRLRLLITNQVQFLPDCDHIVFLEGGRVKSSGTYSKLLHEDTAFQQLVNERENEDEDEKVAEDIKKLPESMGQTGAAFSGSLNTSDVIKTLAQSMDHTSAAISGSVHTPNIGSLDEKAKAGAELIQEEERGTGGIVTKAYYQYAIACGGLFVFSLMLVFWGVVAALSILTQWWLSFWSTEEARVQSGTPGATARSLLFYISIYFALGIAFAILSTLRSVWLLTLALQAGTGLHNRMMHSILHAPMSFFDTTPIGRILSRFSSDMADVDQLLPQAFMQMLTTVLDLLASYIFIAVTTPPFIGVAVPITIGYWLLQRFFSRTSLEVKRLDAISKSPIYAHFSETLSGLSTLRAYNQQESAKADNFKKIDVNQRAFFVYICANRWFSLYLEMMGSLLIFASALFSVVAPGASNPAVLALALTFALQVTSILGFSVRSITELEAQMNSVERVNFYGKELEQEAAAEVDYSKMPEFERPPDDWPSSGAVQIKEVELLYRPGLDLVLKGVSVDVKGGEKVGVIGRTGSGKSTLMVALLRLVELTGGNISVDGVNLADLGLDHIRKSITIIPQDSVLFSGTIRFNLDPFGVYSEPELWDALENSHLKEFVQDFEGGLDARVSEYGENLSAGQRQLICLTRALLRKSKVLILDEASSSLDMETDRLIQETIRLYLKDATILTIAHRLFTLADYDKIIVMDDGRVAEFGSPSELLENSSSQFTGFVESLGESGAKQFREMVALASQQ